MSHRMNDFRTPGATFLIALGCCLPVLAQGGFDGPGRYEITNLKSGKVIDLDRNDQSTVIQFSARNTDNQVWEVQRGPGGFYYLRNGMNGYALQVSGDGNAAPLSAAPYNGSSAQQWRIDRGKDGNAILVNRNGKSIDVPDGTARDGARLQIFDGNGDSNQRFVLRRVTTGRAFGYGGTPGNGTPYGRDPRDRDPRDLNRDQRDRDPRDQGRYTRDERQTQDADRVCFYRDRDFRGEAFCARAGEEIRNVGPGWNDSFSSVRFFGRVRSVEIFDNQDFGGDHMRIRADEPDLGRYRFNDRITSFRVN